MNEAALLDQQLRYPGVPSIPADQVPEHVRESGISSKLLNLAVHFGLVYFGWTVQDYMRHAIKTMGYETIHIWGVQGSRKSNLTLQLGGTCLGEIVRDQWYPDWDRVLKYLVFRPGKEERGFLRLIKSIGEGERIAWTGWDDMGVHYPSTIWRTDMPKYQAIDATWAAVRTKVSVITTNNPLINRVAKNIKDNITIEIFTGRNQMLMTERLCCIPGLRTVDAFFFKVPIEKPHVFDWTAVPSSVWKDYWDIRLRVAETAIQKLDEAYEDEAGDLSGYVPVYEIFDQGIATPSQVLSYSSRDLITVVKVNGKRYVPKEDVEHVLRRTGRAAPRKVSG